MPPRFGQLVIFTFAILAALASPLRAQNAAPSAAAPLKNLIMGTGGVVGFYYPVGGAICRVVNALRTRNGYRCLVESTTGSLHNLNALRTGDLDLAMVQSGWAYQAVRGVGAFAVEGAGSDLRALMALHGEPLTMLVRKDSGISSVADMKRRKINLGRKGTAQRQLTEALFDAMGWTLADFPQAVELEADDQIAALCSGKIEAAAYVIAHPIAVVEEAMTRCNARLLEIDAKTVQKVHAAYPFLAPMSIPGGLYEGQAKPVQTFGMRALLITSSRLPSAAAEAIVSGVVGNFERFQRLHPALELLRPDMLQDSEPVIPLHDGAKRAYRDKKLLGR
ncbi:putative TRAP transporter substrate-binding protein [Rhodospirillaceae bacterium LM-1]|nr:putative TRAP transporter substrate-binding protein [Rhodospirillaceae bacterium LM-1]